LTAVEKVLFPKTSAVSAFANAKLFDAKARLFSARRNSQQIETFFRGNRISYLPVIRKNPKEVNL